jgi:hypothetical protein
LRIETAAETLPTALELLASIPGVNEPTAEGNTISVGGVDREEIPELISTLVEGGVRLFGVAQSEPSLEEVYFALHDDLHQDGSASKGGWS